PIDLSLTEAEIPQAGEGASGRIVRIMIRKPKFAHGMRVVQEIQTIYSPIDLSLTEAEIPQAGEQACLSATAQETRFAADVAEAGVAAEGNTHK
ncbi:MAG: hypothetical protein RR797_06360, partial [Christensenella sp.]